MLAALRKDVKTFPDDGQFQTPTGDLVCLQYLGVVEFPTVSGALDGRNISYCSLDGRNMFYYSLDGWNIPGNRRTSRML